MSDKSASFVPLDVSPAVFCLALSIRPWYFSVKVNNGDTFLAAFWYFSDDWVGILALVVVAFSVEVVGNAVVVVVVDVLWMDLTVKYFCEYGLAVVVADVVARVVGGLVVVWYLAVVDVVILVAFSLAGSRPEAKRS